MKLCAPFKKWKRAGAKPIMEAESKTNAKRSVARCSNDESNIGSFDETGGETSSIDADRSARSVKTHSGRTLCSQADDHKGPELGEGGPKSEAHDEQGAKQPPKKVSKSTHVKFMMNRG